MKIAVVGKMRSGKDTLGRYFYDNDTDGWQNKLAFGDEIKRLALIYFPDIVAKGKPRKLYQMLGQMLREIDPDIWVKALDRNMQYLINKGESNFIVTDVRQMNEYEYLKSKGFTVIKVEANDELRRERIIQAGDVFEPENFYHETETTVDEIPADYIVTNNTTIKDFYAQIRFIHEELKGEKKNGIG